MGNPGILGLLFQIDADPSRAQAALGEFEKSAVASFPRAAAAVEPLNRELITSRESARLLAEEFGVRLPRAVTSAVSGALPSIGQLGSALLAVFALEAVVKFGAEVRKLTADFEALGAAENFMKEIGQENIALIEDESKKSADLARQHIRETLAQVAAEQAHLASIQDKKEGLSNYSVYIASLIPLLTAWHFWTGDLNKEEADSIAKMGSLGKLAVELAKILQGDVRPAHEAAAKAVHEHTQALAAHIPHLPPLQLSVRELAVDWQREEHAETAALQATTKLIMGQSQLTLALHASDAAARGLIAGLSQVPVFEEQAIEYVRLHATALEMVAAASESATAAEGERLIVTLGHRRIAAGIEATWETAKGFAAMGDWDFWAAAQHFMSAAEYGIIAGTRGASPGSAVGSGAGGYGARAGAGDAPRTTQQGTVNVYFEGAICPDCARQIIASINQQVQNRGVVLVATTTTQAPTNRGLR